jgi:hypothetical protein
VDSTVVGGAELDVAGAEEPWEGTVRDATPSWIASFFIGLPAGYPKVL